MNKISSDARATSKVASFVTGGRGRPSRRCWGHGQAPFGRSKGAGGHCQCKKKGKELGTQPMGNVRICVHRGLVTVDGVQVGGARGEEHLHRPVEVVLVVQGLRSLLREVSGAILLLKY